MCPATPPCAPPAGPGPGPGSPWPPAGPLRERALLHAGGTPGTWGNLGLWPAPDYAHACAALARLLGHAAGLQPGARVLGVGCGAGDELLLWAQEFGAAQVLGLEPDPALAAAASRFAGPGVEVRTLPWWALASHTGPAESFDAVVCVDAAYHFSPRPAFLAAAWRALRPGGRLAFTDLVRDPPAPGAGEWGDGPADSLVGGLGGHPGGHRGGRWAERLARRLAGGIASAGRGLALRAAGRLAGVHHADLLEAQAAAARLARAGFTAVQVERLDEAVLDGFAGFARRQGGRVSTQAGVHTDGPAGEGAPAGPGPTLAQDPAWRRVAATARLIPVCRRAGLGMVLLAGSRPMDSRGPDAGAPAASARG